jgi:hypothetical protein
VSQESKPSAAQKSTVQMTRSAGKNLQPPSPYYAPTPGPSSVDSGYASWGTGPSPAPSWMSAPSPGSALSPAPSLVLAVITARSTKITRFTSLYLGIPKCIIRYV